MVTLAPEQQTPMVRQYLEIKSRHQDALLFFRLGDFYELFMDDAIIASKECGLTLTGRGKDESRIPMCGVPHHAADNYTHKLIKKGFKVAICEQIENASDSKEITKRDVVKILTPGTIIGSDHMDAEENHFLAALFKAHDNCFGLSFIDCSTGEFRCCQFESQQDILQFLQRLDPKECLCDESLHQELELDCLSSSYIPLSIPRSSEKLCSFFKINNITSFGLDPVQQALPSACAILDYLSHTQKQTLDHITKCLPHHIKNTMILDAVTIRNLELLTPIHSNDKKGSLFWVLNKTKTSMGARLLRNWMQNPLTNVEAISLRHDAISELKDDLLSREEIREQLHQVYDLERLLSRIVSHINNPRDCIALKESLHSCLELDSILSHFSSQPLSNIHSIFNQKENEEHPFVTITSLISKAIIDSPPQTLAQGQIFKSGYNQELDELKQSFKDIKDWIGSLEKVEQEKTGIKTLRVGFNKVFGYYFQVSKGQTDNVPDYYIRKQTLTNAERYITPELKEKETILLHGEEKQIQLEHELYIALISQLKTFIPIIQNAAKAIAHLDTYQSLASVAQQHNYCRPSFSTDSQCLELSDSRHPVLEKQNPEKIVSNSLSLSSSDFMILITGPNMAGKSTLMKQVALISVMAQMGSFVPASSAKLSIIDRCFTRIGAADNLVEGQSTFMVEMTETATILNNATEKSLVLLDEIGRGTSTYDGMSIAGAVMMHIHNHIKARTLFATHYHELTSITDTCPHVKNSSLAIQEEKGALAFTYKLKEGPADKSYGVHVANMAGLPKSVIDQASSMLSHLESQQASINRPNQLTLF
ncbi:DNA mismatch repair protein MutS [Candidatus Marinamargulisbacteria bacterium SCGC AG-343-D04]|nr:DNA mismatch repair protein MutS [Candidatus Marinamargulisbacteria bacterium SCGC AG-343-D04]